MRILQLIIGIEVGGAEMALLRVSKSLRERGHDVQLICLKRAGTLKQDFEAAGIPVYSLGKPHHWPRVILHARKFKPDILQTWMPHSNFTGVTLLKLIGARHLVWNARQTLNRYKKIPRLTRLMIESCAKLSSVPSAIIYNSQQGRTDHEARGYKADHGIVIENGFSIPELSPDLRAQARGEFDLPERALLSIFVGRNHRDKDVGTFITGALAMAQKSDTYFAFAGRGFSASEVPELIASLPDALRSRFLWLGSRNQKELESLYRAADFIVSTSISEGFSNALAEAMSFGAIPIATNVGESRNIVAGLGEVIEPKDIPGLTAAWSKLGALSPEERAKRRDQIRESIASRFSNENCVQRYIQLYQGLEK